MIVGEVVNVDSLTQFQMQQTNGGDEVKLGSFVIIEENQVVGVIGDISVLNPNMGSYPRPKRLPEDSKLPSIFPDLVEQFPTIVNVYVLGYSILEITIQEIPIRPPQIYNKVRLLTEDEIKNFHINNETELPYLNYLIRLQMEQSPIIDRMIRLLLENVANSFDITLDEILEVME